MNADHLKECLSILKLSNSDLARLLDVSERTVQRWMSSSTAVPGAAARAIEAWILLDKAAIPWRPDGVPLSRAFLNGITSMVLPIRSERTIKDIIESVYARGGPNTPWVVRLDQRQACLEHAWIKYKPLSNCSFIPLSFGRTDRAPDLTRDFSLIEEGYACIAHAMSKAESLRLTHNWMEIAI